MGNFLIRLLINSVALWLTTYIVQGVTIVAYGPDEWDYIVTLVVVALIFGLVNGIVGTLIRVVAFPLYILTLGIIALFVNAFLLWLVALISGFIGWGLYIDDYFWSGIWGALVLAIISWVLGLILRPATRSDAH